MQVIDLSRDRGRRERIQSFRAFDAFCFTRERPVDRRSVPGANGPVFAHIYRIKVGHVVWHAIQDGRDTVVRLNLIHIGVETTAVVPRIICYLQEVIKGTAILSELRRIETLIRGFRLLVRIDARRSLDFKSSERQIVCAFVVCHRCSAVKGYIQDFIAFCTERCCRTALNYLNIGDGTGVLKVCFRVADRVFCLGVRGARRSVLWALI